MNDRRGEPGFSVAPRPLGDDRRRSLRRVRRLAIALGVAAAITIVAIGWLGPRLTGRPDFDIAFFATPTPDPSARPTGSPGASPGETRPGDESLDPEGPTPLPEVTRNEAADPTGRVAIAADGLRILDLQSGQLEKGTDFVLGTDAVVRAPGDRGWSCICLTDDLVDGLPVRTVKVTAIGPTGSQFDSFDVLTLPVSIGDDFGQASPLVDVDVDDGGRAGLLAIATVAKGRATVEVSPIDIDRRQAGDRVELGRVSVAGPPQDGGSGASPGPTPASQFGSYLDGPHVRIAPGGRIAFVWVTVQTNSDDAVVTTAVHAWRVELNPFGGVTAAQPIDGLAALPAFCANVTFAATDRLAWFCPQFSFEPTGAGPTGWVIGTADLLGREAGSRSIAVHDDAAFGEPLVDRANGWLYAWDATALVLTRLDVHTLASATVTLDPAARSAPGIAPGGDTDRPAWRDMDSAVELLPYIQIAGSPDGARIYVAGLAQLAAPETPAQGSLGIFVIDRATLAVLDRWAPGADYVAISVDRAGQVLATGMPGVDAAGAAAPWQGSLTVHDPADGRILVRYGRLGQGGPPLVFDR